MAKNTYIFFILFLYSIKGFSQIDAFASYAVFQKSPGEYYAELYLRVPIKGLPHIYKKNANFIAQARASLVISSDTGTVYQEDFMIRSPEMSVTSSAFDLIEMRRIILLEGKYPTSITLISDSGDTLSVLNYEINIKNELSPWFSDILLMDTFYAAEEPSLFVRNGISILPLVHDVCSEHKNLLPFYTEFYATEGKGKFTFKYFVTDEFGTQETKIKYVTRVISPIIPFFDVVNITELPAGAHYLIFEVTDPSGNLVSTVKKGFQKNRSINYNSQLQSFINDISYSRLQPLLDPLSFISAPRRKKQYVNIIETEDTIALKKWAFEHFFAEYPQNPQLQLRHFEVDLQYVNTNFPTQIDKGYQSSRGITYLKYGKPDQVTPYFDEPNAYAYEIWHYYNTSKQSNVKFVFYNPSQLHNDFRLLHSDMSGEINNPNWKELIYRRFNRNNNINEDRVPDGFGNQLDKRYNE